MKLTRVVQITGLVIILIIIYIGIITFLMTSEGFEQRCGVDLPSCSGLRCMNGYCKSDIPPRMKQTTLKVIP